MSDSITLTIPAFSPEEIAKLETEYQVAEGKELEAVRTLRESYGRLAKYAGRIQIGNYDKSTSNYSIDEYLYYERDGDQVRGFLAFDSFRQPQEEEYRGPNVGFRVYLTEHSEWLELERTGRWSTWSGEVNWWGCGVDPNPSTEHPVVGGSIRVVSDEYIIRNYNLDELIKELAHSLKGLQDRLPTRFKKLRERAALAEQVVTSLAGGVK